MAMTQVAPKTATFETSMDVRTFEGTSATVVTKTVTTKHVASFNGKIYNGKRYINDLYRPYSGANQKERTHIWQDGFGWVEGGLDVLAELFGLE